MKDWEWEKWLKWTETEKTLVEEGEMSIEEWDAERDRLLADGWTSEVDPETGEETLTGPVRRMVREEVAA